MDESELGDDRVSEVSAYLTKPVASERLQEVVGRMLNDGAPAKV